MNKTNVMKSLVRIANKLDERGMTKEADAITDVATRVAQHSWWQNEAGEPLYSPEAIRAEERDWSEPDFDDDGYDYPEEYNNGPDINEMIDALLESGYSQEKIDSMSNDEIEDAFYVEGGWQNNPREDFGWGGDERVFGE